MQVGVHEAVQEDHAADAAHAGVDDAAHVDALGLELVLAHAVDELHREHGVGAGVGDEAGKGDVRIVGEVGGEAPLCSRLVGRGGSAPRRRRRTPASAPASDIRRSDGTRRSSARPTKSRIERSSATFSTMSGRRTFTATTLAAVAQHGAMHLRHRRGRDGLGIEVGVDVVERAPEVALSTMSAHGRERERRHVVAQQRQLVDQRAGQQVGARRGDLPHLDEGGAERGAEAHQRAAGGVRHDVAAIRRGGAGRSRARRRRPPRRRRAPSAASARRCGAVPAGRLRPGRPSRRETSTSA